MYMSNGKKTSIAGILVSLTLVTACSSLDRTAEIADSHFVSGTSRKSDIVNSIGLPDDVKKNSGDGTETWFYKGEPTASYVVPVAAGQSGAGTANILMTETGTVNSNAPVTLICVFDKKGVLIESRHPRNGNN